MSNKTPKENAKKIKLAPNLVGLAVVVAGAALTFIVLTSMGANNNPSNLSGTSNGSQCIGLQALNECYVLERATTTEARVKGLSDRDNLPDKNGMLFTFEKAKEQCIWMKGMRFDLDIIWLNEAKEINHIEQKVSPSSYPNTFCSKDTKYVIELNSGKAAKLKLVSGQKLIF